MSLQRDGTVIIAGALVFKTQSQGALSVHEMSFDA